MLRDIVQNSHFLINLGEKIGVDPQLAFTCSKLAIDTIEQGVKYVQN